MKTLLRVVTTRYGIAGLLVLAVLGTVLITRLMGGEIGNPLGNAAAPGFEPTISVGPDDGLTEDEEAPARPTLPSKAGDPLPIADKFAAAWIEGSVSAEEWRSSLRPYATRDLMRRLEDVGPSNLPADEITGKAELTSVGSAQWAEATVTTDTGDLVLGLVRSDKQWRVDSISFTRT